MKLAAPTPEITSAWCSESALKKVLSCHGETPAENSMDVASSKAAPSVVKTTMQRYSKIWDHLPSMSAAKIADLLGLLPGCCTMLADAIRVKSQALLVGVPTRVRLPHDQWPASWSKMRDPVVPLRLALYGHPDAGTCLEKHCDAKLSEKGFSPAL